MKNILSILLLALAFTARAATSVFYIPDTQIGMSPGITNGNANFTSHGLLPILSGNPDDVLNGVGEWVPSGVVSVRSYGAFPDDELDDTESIQAAIDAAIEAKASVYFPPGYYDVEPWSTNTHVLVLHYSSYPAGSGIASITEPAGRQDTPQYGSMLLFGDDTGNRPESAEIRGAVIRCNGDMTGKIAMISGYLARGTTLKNLTFLGTGFDVAGSIGFRHNTSASHLRMENCVFQRFYKDVDISGDIVDAGIADVAGDFNSFWRCSFWYSQIGVEFNGFNSCVNDFFACSFQTRIHVKNTKAQAGLTPSPAINIYGGAGFPDPQWDGILLTGVVTAATSSSITITNLTKFIKSGIETGMPVLTDSAGSIADIVTNEMFFAVEKDCLATGVAKPPTFGGMRRITSINAGTWTLTTTATVNDADIINQPVYIAKPAWCFQGANFRVYSFRAEGANSDDVGFGGGFAELEGWADGSEFYGITFQRYAEGSGFNAIWPIVYHKPVSASHAFPLTFKGGSLYSTYPNFQVEGTAGVTFDNVKFLSRPRVLDHTGRVADGVKVIGGQKLFHTSLPFDYATDNAENRSLLTWLGSDTYIASGGLFKRVPRNVTASPTSGTSGEKSILESSPHTLYSIGSPLNLDAYYNSTAIPGTAAIEAGSNIATVTDMTGLERERAVSIAGAGTAGGLFTSRIVFVDKLPDGTELVHFATAAGTTVAAGAMDEVAAVVESALDAGRITAQTPQLIAKGGASGARIIDIVRDSITNSISLNGDEFLIYEPNTSVKFAAFSANAASSNPTAFFQVNNTNGSLAGNLAVHSITSTNGTGGYLLTAGGANASPADSTVYYFGGIQSLSPALVYDRVKMQIPRSGVVKKWTIHLYIVGTLGTGETVAQVLRLNDTTDFGTINSTYNAATVEGASGELSQAVSAGDFLSVKFTGPAWATNPTSVYFYANIYIE